jgi:hypothetical protein
MWNKSKSCSMVSAVLTVCFINKVANGAGWLVAGCCPPVRSGRTGMLDFWILDWNWIEYVTTPWFFGTSLTVFYNHTNLSGFKIHSWITFYLSLFTASTIFYNHSNPSGFKIHSWNTFYRSLFLQHQPFSTIIPTLRVSKSILELLFTFHSLQHQPFSAIIPTLRVSKSILELLFTVHCLLLTFLLLPFYVSLSTVYTGPRHDRNMSPLRGFAALF